MSAAGESFPLAPMSRSLMVMTLVLLALPLGFLAAAALGLSQLMGPGLLMVIIYGWIWLRFRPTRFVVRPDLVEVVWPLKRRRIPRAGIASVRLIDRQDLKREVGWGMRVGAGGLWGGFGWLATRRRGIVRMYISRPDGFVWIECVGGRPWLLTPEEPEAFVRALSS
jgi:hypothetical protein